jgi:hypothetical protein
MFEPKAPAASASAPRRPMIITSVAVMAACARLVSIMGHASASIAHASARQ